MIDKGTVISTALQRLGELGAYNDNGSVIYTRASEYFDRIIDRIAVDSSFLYNATTVTLTKTSQVSELGENSFNAPVDMLNKLRTNPVKGVRLEGTVFYSKEEEIILQYCKKLPLTKIPDYMEEYLIYALCVDMARTHNSYVDRLEYSETMLREEKGKILAMEGLDKIIFDEDTDGSDYLYPTRR